MVTLILALLIGFAWWAPDSGFGRTANRAVMAGLRRLASIRPLTMVCFGLIVVAFAGLIVYGQLDGLIIAGPAAPETFAVFLSIDVGLAVEVLVVAWWAARRRELNAIVKWITALRRSAARRAIARRSSRRRRSRSTARPSVKDDPERPEWEEFWLAPRWAA
ncbi:MAG: hypothetical protein ACK4YQ_16240 [Phenylobacterium sp.]|uniref:hypothetical protein n=1 Tax=Phenylobacterium sp. TaxID=1871053 RepID=UPI00391B46DE